MTSEQTSFILSNHPFITTHYDNIMINCTFYVQYEHLNCQLEFLINFNFILLLTTLYKFTDNMSIVYELNRWMDS